MKTLETLASEALLLPNDQRLTLAHRILSSVEPRIAPDIEDAWDKEIRSRIARYDSGDVKGIDGPSVFAMLDKKLAK